MSSLPHGDGGFGTEEKGKSLLGCRDVIFNEPASYVEEYIIVMIYNCKIKQKQKTYLFKMNNRPLLEMK